MTGRKKSEKKIKRVYHSDEAHLLTDIMIVFIGLCIFILAFLSLTGKVPEEYAFGATLAGLCFVFSDVLLVEEKISGKGLIMYGLFLFFGLASFILLPVILLMDIKLKEILMSDSDFFTFLALGLVLMLIGYKTLLRKIKRQEGESENNKQLKEDFLILAERYNETSELIESLKRESEEARLQHDEPIKDNN